MVLSQQFKPSEIFSSDNKLVQLSEKLMMEILEEPQHEEQRPSPEIPISNSRQLTPQMIQHMTVFYTSVLNMNILNFDETVVEITKSCEHVDNYGRSYQFIGKGCKRRQNSVVKVPCSSGTLFGEIVLFLCHKVNSIVHKWVVLDIFPLSEKEKGFFHFENKVVCQRLCHISALSRPLAHVRNQNATL